MGPFRLLELSTDLLSMSGTAYASSFYHGLRDITALGLQHRECHRLLGIAVQTYFKGLADQTHQGVPVSASWRLEAVLAAATAAGKHQYSTPGNLQSDLQNAGFTKLARRVEALN